jgi:outer membrane protein
MNYKHKYMRRINILIMLAVFNCGTMKSQDKLSLDLEEAINYALENNLSIKNAGLDIEEASEKVKETLAAGLPQLNATVDYSNFLGAEIELRFSEEAPATTIPFKPTSNLQLSVGQLILSGSYIVGVQIANMYRQMMETGYKKSEQDIKEQVSKTYYLVLVSEKNREISEKNLSNIRDIYEKTKPMADVGIVEKTDVDQLYVQVSLVENLLISAEAQVELSYNILRLQLGAGVDKEIELTESLEEILVKINFETLLIEPLNINSNLDYQLLQSQQRITEKQVTLEKMSFLPVITGYYNYTEKILKPDFDISPKNVIGLNMNIPLFSSGMRRAKLNQAKINMLSFKNNMELLEEQLLINEKQLKYNLKIALEQYENQKENAEVSKRVYENIRLKFQQGIVSSLDLTTANSNYITAEANYIKALMNLLEADVSLKKLYSSL